MRYNRDRELTVPLIDFGNIVRVLDIFGFALEIEVSVSEPTCGKIYDRNRITEIIIDMYKRHSVPAGPEGKRSS